MKLCFIFRWFELSVLLLLHLDFSYIWTPCPHTYILEKVTHISSWHWWTSLLIHPKSILLYAYAVVLTTSIKKSIICPVIGQTFIMH